MQLRGDEDPLGFYVHTLVTKKLDVCFYMCARCNGLSQELNHLHRKPSIDGDSSAVPCLLPGGFLISLHLSSADIIAHDHDLSSATTKKTFSSIQAVLYLEISELPGTVRCLKRQFTRYYLQNTYSPLRKETLPLSLLHRGIPLCIPEP